MKRTIALLLLLALPAFAAAQQWSSTVDGVTAYFGVVPSALARDWLAPHGASERDAHGIVTSTDHHFLVALFDAATGQRIESAEVSASHQPDPSGDGVKTLSSMRIADTTTFGNFFALSGAQSQRFTVNVRVPQHAQPLTFTFTYEPLHDRP